MRYEESDWEDAQLRAGALRRAREWLSEMARSYGQCTIKVKRGAALVTVAVLRNSP